MRRCDAGYEGREWAEIKIPGGGAANRVRYIYEDSLHLSMLKKERQAYIIQQINVHNKVLSSDLSIQLNVSEDTVRRDLQELAEEGKLIKVHGGALSKSFHFTLESNVIYSQPEKKSIAYKALQLIQDGMMVLLSGGTTIRELVKSLPPDLNATFITVSVPIALELLDHPTSEVIFIGNKLLKNAQMSTGAEVVQRLSQIKADLCFLGTNSFDPGFGITDLEWEIIEVKRAMIKSAQKTVSLAISEKLNTIQRLQVCRPEEIDILITELDPDEPLLAPFRQTGIQVL
jgi:DeoR/GlpR family transcriptional regulator of sugar metabolism